MSFIKMTGIDNNKNIVKWLKIDDDEDNIYNYKLKNFVKKLIIKRRNNYNKKY